MAILWPNGLTTPPAVSSGFGPRGSGAYGDASTYHRGTDFVGFDVVHSIADGTVVYVGWNTGVGWSSVAGFMIWVQHDGFFSRYLHTAAGTQRVAVGDRVTAGQALIDMGYSGLFDNAGNPAPWRKHVHVEIAPGAWNRSNIGQVDPHAWLSERVGGETTTAGGGSAVAPVIESEEDDVKLYRVTPNGRHYAVAPGFIKQITGKESVKAYEKAAGVKEAEIDGDEFTVVLGVNGISTVSAPVVDGQGRILDERDPSKGYVHGGSWARTDKAERYAYSAQKE